MAVIVAGGKHCRSDTPDIDSAFSADTVLFQQEDLLGSTSPVTNMQNFERRLHQNPTAGLFKSMLIPGLGQIGNKKYLKAGVFLALDAWFVGSAIHYGQQAAEFREGYEGATSLEMRNEYYDLYLDRKDQRNKFTWFAVIVAFVSMFDAYADAHLSGYPRLEDSSKVEVVVEPLPEQGVLASIRLTF